jgi:hypothetical protein
MPKWMQSLQRRRENIPKILLAPILPRHLLDKCLSRLEKEASQFRKLKKILSSKRFNYSDRGRWIFACGLSQVPKVSLYSLEQAIPFTPKTKYMIEKFECISNRGCK